MVVQTERHGSHVILDNRNAIFREDEDSKKEPAIIGDRDNALIITGQIQLNRSELRSQMLSQNHIRSNAQITTIYAVGFFINKNNNCANFFSIYQ